MLIRSSAETSAGMARVAPPVGFDPAALRAGDLDLIISLGEFTSTLLCRMVVHICYNNRYHGNGHLYS